MRTRAKQGQEKKTVSLTVKITPTFRGELDEVFPYSEELADKVRGFLADQVELRKAANAANSQN